MTSKSQLKKIRAEQQRIADLAERQNKRAKNLFDKAADATPEEIDLISKICVNAIKQEYQTRIAKIRIEEIITKGGLDK